ncbi:MAG: HPr family phosphocarrier protein [Cellvibrionaceae bacterium]|nr:HPr family phosphocarrier protein [Cellvibrionaceae bacterium]
MITTDLVIINKLGLHARAAAKLANTAGRFGCDINMTTKGKTVDCKSVMALMLLAAAQGTTIKLHCQGSDQQAANDAICELINNRFDEGE